MIINKRAPVMVVGEIEVAATPEVVWEVITAIEQWPTWNPDVKWVSLNGDVVEGTQFRWKAGPETIISTIHQVERLLILAWTGKTLGVNATHVWRMDAQNGHTIVRIEESWEGLMARIFRDSSQKMLETAIETGLQYLKAEAERRSIS
jgi:hypothetical protein